MTQVLPPRGAEDAVAALVDPAGSSRSAALIGSSPGPAGPMTVDLLVPDDWWRLRAARLTALLDAPEAFATTYAAELLRKPGQWTDLVGRSPWVAARHGDEVVGIACLAAEDREGPTRRFVESVWVTPRQRRRGIVRAMLHELEDRARRDGAEALQLWVLDTNDSAADAYLKLGFDWLLHREQDSPKLYADGTPVRERLMVRPLRP